MSTLVVSGGTDVAQRGREGPGEIRGADDTVLSGLVSLHLRQHGGVERVRALDTGVHISPQPHGSCAIATGDLLCRRLKGALRRLLKLIEMMQKRQNLRHPQWLYKA